MTFLLVQRTKKEFFCQEISFYHQGQMFHDHIHWNFPFHHAGQMTHHFLFPIPFFEDSHLVELEALLETFCSTKSWPLQCTNTAFFLHRILK